MGLHLIASNATINYRCGEVLSDRPMPVRADAVIRERERSRAQAAQKALREGAVTTRASQERAFLARYPNLRVVEDERNCDLEPLHRAVRSRSRESSS